MNDTENIQNTDHKFISYSNIQNMLPYQHISFTNTLIVDSLARLGKTLPHLLDTMNRIYETGATIHFAQSQIDAPALVRGLITFEKDIQKIRKRNSGAGRKPELSQNQILAAQAAMQLKSSSVKEICEALGISKSTLYRYLSPEGDLRKTSF